MWAGVCKWGTRTTMQSNRRQNVYLAATNVAFGRPTRASDRDINARLRKRATLVCHRRAHAIRRILVSSSHGGRCPYTALARCLESVNFLEEFRVAGRASANAPPVTVCGTCAVAESPRTRPSRRAWTSTLIRERDHAPAVRVIAPRRRSIRRRSGSNWSTTTRRSARRRSL